MEEHFKIHCINNALDDTQYCVLWEKVISELKSDAEYLKSECEEALVIIFFCSHSLFICAPVILLYITIVLIMRAHSISIKYFLCFKKSLNLAIFFLMVHKIIVHHNFTVNEIGYYTVVFRSSINIYGILCELERGVPKQPEQPCTGYEVW